jgi:DnaJ-class molecular chaperone
MNNFAKLNYYELLEVAIDASPFEIRRGYRNALELYNENSLLTYSLFSQAERIKIFKEIEVAYNTLIDGSKRKAYDALLNAKSAALDRQKNHDLVLTAHNRLGKENLIGKAHSDCSVSGGLSGTTTAAQNITVDTRRERSLTNIDSVAQQAHHGGSVENEDFDSKKSLWLQLSYKALVLMLFLALILIALSALGVHWIY